MTTRVTDLFRSLSTGPLAVGPSHARGVIESPDGRDEIDYDGLRLLLFTRHIRTAKREHVLLVVCTQRDDGPLELSLGLRLYGAGDELRSLASEPRSTLLALVGRFGLPVNIGGRVALLHERAILEAGESIGWPDAGPFVASALVRRQPDGSSEVTWAFVIDTTAYGASLAGD